MQAWEVHLSALFTTGDDDFLPVFKLTGYALLVKSDIAALGIHKIDVSSPQLSGLSDGAIHGLSLEQADANTEG